MNPRDALFLGHIVAAAREIQAFDVEGREAFSADRKTYFRVDIDAVWAMVEGDLPALRANVQRLLDARPA